MSNLELWDKLAPVSKDATKEFKRAGGFKGTDINPQWRMRRMTETFGPVGVGWGYELMDRWIDRVPHGDGEACIAFCQVRVWYRAYIDNETGEIIGVMKARQLQQEPREQKSGGVFVSGTRQPDPDDPELWTGPQIGGTVMTRTPDEAYKMAITDALGKCFAQIGLGADVYMGEFDKPDVFRAKQEDIDEIGQLMSQHNIDSRNFYKALGIATLEDLSSEDVGKARKLIEAKTQSQLIEAVKSNA